MGTHEPYKLIRVTMEVDYYIPMVSEKISEINGWTVDEIIQDWFKNHNINDHHASRDAFLLGGSRTVKSIETVCPQEGVKIIKM